MPRPAGVTILAILAILVGAYNALQGLTGMTLLMAGIPTSGLLRVILVGAIYIVAGVGLLKLANWARLAITALAASGLVFPFFADWSLPFSLFSLWRRLITAGIDVSILWYLWRPHVKRAFSSAIRGAPTI